MQSNAEQCVRLCEAIGNRALDADAFVPVRALLAEFGTELVLRPLLVEAMLVETDITRNPEVKVPWQILLDSESHDLGSDRLQRESVSSPLPDRTRNTVAHELVHLLGFRATEFGMTLRNEKGKLLTTSEAVESIEREVEKLSPILLMPLSALERRLGHLDRRVDVETVSRIRKELGVSRYVFASRLQSLRRGGGDLLLLSEALTNVAIGVGRWVSARSALLQGWPLFANSDSGLKPIFLLDAELRETTPFNVLLPTLNLSGSDGVKRHQFVTAAFGTSKSRNVNEELVTCSIEDVERKPGQTFFVVFSWGKSS